MQSNRHIWFRWTPRTARISFIYIAVVPAIIGYLGYKTDVRRLPLPLPSRIPGSSGVGRYDETTTGC